MAKLVKNGVVSISSKALPSCLNTQFMVIWILMENLSTNFSPKLNCRHLIKSRKSKPKSLFLSKLLIDLFKLRLFRWLSSHLQKISPKPYFTFFFIQGNMSPFSPCFLFDTHYNINIIYIQTLWTRAPIMKDIGFKSHFSQHTGNSWPAGLTHSLGLTVKGVIRTTTKKPAR